MTLGRLAIRLRKHIKTHGPLSFHDWMQCALYDESEGYYFRHELKRWGRCGDYRTSAETSTLFAATMADYFANYHKAVLSNERLTILEAGAGEGHFAFGVLQAFECEFQDTYSKSRYLIDEISPENRKRASRVLARHEQIAEFVMLSKMREGSITGVIFANELLDAFPVHLVRNCAGVLKELFVNVDSSGVFVFEEGKLTDQSLSSYFQEAELADDQIAEANVEAELWVEHAAAVLKQGLVIIVDYGAFSPELYDQNHRKSGTIRAFSGHTLRADLLARPGEQDLTSTINWTRVIEVGERAGLRVVLFEPLPEFLLGMGFFDRLGRLEKRLSVAEVLSLRLEARRMILPGEMGSYFQVLVMEK